MIVVESEPYGFLLRNNYQRGSPREELASARLMASSNNSSSKGLNSTATASDFSASARILGSVRPVISIVGSPRPKASRDSDIATPVISGRSMSTTMHAFEVGVSLAINSDGLANAFASNPEAESSRFSELRTEGSSSITSTVAGRSVLTASSLRAFDLACVVCEIGVAASFLFFEGCAILVRFRLEYGLPPGS